MKIRTRAFLLGLIPALMMAALLTAYHVYSSLVDLERTQAQQGMALVRHLGTAAEYGVISGNERVLELLLEQAMKEPGVKSVLLVRPDRSSIVRGEAVERMPALGDASQWQDAWRSWFAHPVTLSPLEEHDLFLDEGTARGEPLAWVVVGIDLQQRRQLATQLLLASLGITLLGILLTVLLVRELALTGIRPLMDIIATVKRISSGAFGVRMEVTARSPELRELQAMVNQMSESLRSYREEMEARILLATAELEQKKREAEQANQAKSRFLAAASHDLRQPMHALSLYVESLKPQMKGRAAEQTLQKLERSILSMVEMFNAILDVSRLDAGVIQPSLGAVRVRRLLLDLADEFAGEADAKGVALRLRCPDLWVESDAILLERIVRNLLSNALRHTVKGGVLLSARRRQDGLRLQVWDTGSGIAEEDQPRVFYEFYQGEGKGSQAHQGLGLGLAIVRRLARLLGYPLQLHSRPGRGTVFSLDVPLAGAEACGLDAPGGEATGPALRGRAVVIDDDADVRDALGRLLTAWGMEVQLAAGLGEIEARQEPEPDVVVADYQLGLGATGVEAIEALRRRWGRAIPAILVTGDTRASAMQALDALGYPVLYKPVQPGQLLAQLQSALGHARAGERGIESLG